MATFAGATALYGRIRSAARQVCGDPGRNLSEQHAWDLCLKHAIEGAVSAVNSPLLTNVYRRENHRGSVTALAIW